MACKNCYKYPLCEYCTGFKNKLDMKEYKTPEDKTETYSFSEIGGTKIYWKTNKAEIQKQVNEMLE